MAEGRHTLDPKLDIVFWMLFAAERNRGLLISLLDAVLRPADPISGIAILPAQPEKINADDKAIALDIRVQFASGEQVDVEMQSQKRPALRERSLYYWARLYGGQLPRGSGYVNLHRCVVVLITNFTELSSPHFHSTFGVCELENGERLTDHLALHVVELPKLRRAMEHNPEPDLLAWGRFLAATTDDELEALARSSPILRSAKEALERLSADPEARALAEQREMALLMQELDYATMRRKGLAEGRAEGRAEGIVLGKASLLIKLLEQRFGALPAEAMAKLRAAGEADLDRWSERVLTTSSIAELLS